nr:unnamed protein product [Digitaria exilis]
MCAVSSGTNTGSLLSSTARSSNRRSTALATNFICRNAISFPRHVLGPPWNTGNSNADTPSPCSNSHRHGRNSPASAPQIASILPIPTSPSAACFESHATGGYSRIVSHSAAWSTRIFLDPSSPTPMTSPPATPPWPSWCSSMISRSTSASTSRWRVMSQKNHVSADEVVSRPAMMKLITMSRITSSPYPAAAMRDTRSSSPPPRRARHRRRRRMSSVMAPWITAISSRRRRSEPTPSARFAFHTAATGAAPRRATIAAAASNADSSLDITGNNGVSSSHTAYDVERELPQELLHVDDGHGDLTAGLRRGVERREEARAGLGLERGSHALPEGPGGELVADELALGAPRLAVDVEDAAAEEVAERLREGLPLGIVPKVTLEDVLDVRPVRGHHGASRAEAFHDERLRRRRREEAGVPVEQPATVPVELHQAAQHRVAPRRVPMSGANSMAEGAEEEEAGSHEW